MVIKYEDITLRAIEESDLEMIRDMINDPDIENMVVGSGFPVSKYQQQRWFESIQDRKDQIRLVIDTQKHGSVGVVMLTDINYINGSAEIHIKITSDKNKRRNGYAYKTYMAIIEHAFNYMNLNRIESNVIEYNIASKKLNEKCGFKQEGIKRQAAYKKGCYYNVHIWSIIKEDWKVTKQYNIE